MVLKNYKLLLAMLLSILCTRASAYGFAVQNSDEVTIYYDDCGYDSNLGSYVARVTYKSYNSATSCSEGYEGVTTLNIPEKVTYGDVEYTVKYIDYRAFQGCSGLTSVTIPNSVTSIGDVAFSGCSGLTSVTIGNSVTSIGVQAFYQCTGLTSVTIGNSVTSIDSGAFQGCSGLTSVTIPNSVTSIGYAAFSGCSGLTSVAIPNSVTSIGNYAFEYCSGLTSVTIGNSVTSIGEQAFYDCSYLTSVTIPSSVTSIGNSAFYGCDGLTSVTIPSSVTSIGESAFYGVGALELEATEPIVLTAQIIGSKSTVIYVPQSALEAYRSADVWNDVRVNIIAKEAVHAFDVETPVLSTIGPNQFENVVSLKLSGNVGSEDVMYIRNKMYNLQHLDLTDAVFVESTEEYASGRKIHAGKCGGFYSLSNLRSVKLPTSTGTIEESAFESCSYLRNVTFPVGIKNIGTYAFRDCSALEFAVLPEGLKTIGAVSFMDCKRLKSVAFPSTLETIGEHVFCGCSQLTTVSLPTSLKSIGGYAFQDCTALEELRIPSSVEAISAYAFYNCSKLKDIYTYTVLPTVINSNTFSTYTTATLHAPKQGFTNYYSNAQWGQFPSIVDFDEPYTYFYLNDDLTLDDTTGRIEGEGDDNPDADVNPGGGLIVEGNGDQDLDDLHIHEGDNSGGSVIGDGNIDANNLFIDIYWCPLKLPFSRARMCVCVFLINQG